MYLSSSGSLYIVYLVYIFIDNSQYPTDCYVNTVLVVALVALISPLHFVNRWRASHTKDDCSERIMIKSLHAVVLICFPDF